MKSFLENYNEIWEKYGNIGNIILRNLIVSLGIIKNI